MMKDDREKVFASVRRNLRGIEKVSPDRSGKSPLKSAIDGNNDSLFAGFRSELAALGGDAVIARNTTAAAEFILSHMDSGSAAFVYQDVKQSYTEIADALARSNPVRFESDFRPGYDRRELASIGGAVSCCAACIAETGTIVLDNDMRLPAALAAKLFIIADREKLLPSLDDLFSERFIGVGGSTLFLITGPSRTADIEKQLVKGVHGPKEVYVIFTEE